MPGVCPGGDVEASIWLVHYCMNDRDFTVKSTVYLLVYPEKRLSKRTVVMFTDLPLSLYTIFQGANETKCTGILAHKLN